MNGRKYNFFFFKMLNETDQQHLCNTFILLNNVNYQIKCETYKHNGYN